MSGVLKYMRIVAERKASGRIKKKYYKEELPQGRLCWNCGKVELSPSQKMCCSRECLYEYNNRRDSVVYENRNRQ